MVHKFNNKTKMKTIITILNSIINILNRIVTRLTRKQLGLSKVTLDKIMFQDKGRYLIYYFNNVELESSEQVLHSIFNILLANERFTKFGERKIIITSAIINNSEFSYHPNVLITNKTTFEEYYEEVIQYISDNYDDGYPCNIIPRFKVRVWNMDHLANKTIKINTSPVRKINTKGIKLNRGYHTSAISLDKKYNPCINPLKPDYGLGLEGGKELLKIATMDIETMVLPNFDNIQIPVVITMSTLKESKIFVIDSTILSKESDNLSRIEKGINNLWKEYIDYLKANSKNFDTIFVHNLGNFDGLFLYKGLINNLEPKKVSSIIDDHNKFIMVNYKSDEYNFTWKDSYRIFPVSLDNLCDIFGVEGKVSKYKEVYNSTNLFNKPDLLKEFMDYSIQDSISLYKALIEAQQLYANTYYVDICTIFSTSTLSLKIFRSRFLKVNIPILKGTQDSFIRKAYYGGATDYYKARAVNIKYIDVNSLYPSQMLKQEMPVSNPTYFEGNIRDFDKEAFGFFFCKIETPKYLKHPILQTHVKTSGGLRTVAGLGTWEDMVFSKEMDNCIKKGYKF